MRITKSYRFEAAHVLPHHAGKCARLHGHSYRLEVTVSGPLLRKGPAAGMIMDFDDLSRVVKREVVDRLDHTHLNDVEENPTCERLLLWMWDALSGELRGLETLTLWETDTSRSSLSADDLEARGARP